MPTVNAAKWANAAARAYDNSPISIHTLARRVAVHGTRKAEMASMQDEKYAAIAHARRDPNSPDAILMLSHADGLGMEEVAYQARVETAHEPWYTTWAWKATHLKATRAVQWIHRHTSRARHGWAPTDAWNADTYLAAVAAGVLGHLAEHGQSWPGDHTKWPTPQAWRDELRTHAAALSAYAKPSKENEEALEEWYNLATTSKDTPEEAAALKRIEEAESKARAGAQEAFTWIGENLTQLWD